MVRRRQGRENPVKWNPYNRVVQDHRDGTVDVDATDRERARRGLPVPWTPEVAVRELGLHDLRHMP